MLHIYIRYIQLSRMWQIDDGSTGDWYQSPIRGFSRVLRADRCCYSALRRIQMGDTCAYSDLPFRTNRIGVPTKP